MFFGCAAGDFFIVSFHMSAEITGASLGKALISITLVPKRITTAATRFAECPMHSAKAPMHSANPLPSATLDKEAPSNLFTVKSALPSAKSRALGKGLTAVGRRLTPS